MVAVLQQDLTKRFSTLHVIRKDSRTETVDNNTFILDQVLTRGVSLSYDTEEMGL